MNGSNTHKKVLLAELALTLKNVELAFKLFSQLSTDVAVQKNLYLYSSVLFGLGICHVCFERYDVGYVQFMKVNTLWPDSRWASFALENATLCIEELGGEALALEQFLKNIKTCKNSDNFLSVAYHAYFLKTVRDKALVKALKQLEEMLKFVPSQKKERTEEAYEESLVIALKTSYLYFNHAFKVAPTDAIVLKCLGRLHQEMNKLCVKEWRKNEDVLFALADYYRKESQPNKAQKIYHNWFNGIEKKRLAEGKAVSMLSLLELEAKCYEDMGHPQEAIKVLQRQEKLFSNARARYLKAFNQNKAYQR